MKFSVFTVMLPDLNPAQAIPALKQAGYDAVCWRVAPKDPAKAKEAPSFWGNNLCTLDLNAIEAEAAAVAPLCRAAGLETATLTSYLELDKFQPAQLEAVLRAAQSLGAPFVRVNAPKYDGKAPFQGLMDSGRARLKEVEMLAAAHGVKVNLEIHMNMISCSPSLVRQLVDGRDPRHIGVIFEPANMVVEGQENHRMSLEILGPYLATLHVKNMGWVKGPAGWKAEAMPLAEGMVDWKAEFALLKEFGYDGLVSVEDFCGWSSQRKLAEDLPYIKAAAGIGQEVRA